MTAIDRVGPLTAPRPGARPAGPGAGAGFSPPAEQAADAARPNLATAAPVALDALLALQQMDDAPSQDRAARRHGQALLAALGRLQRGLLGGNTGCGLTELRALADSVPQAADPALAAAVAQVVLRARIELVRRDG